MRYFGLVWKNAIRNRRRSILTVLSMAASFCLLGVLLAMYNALFVSNQETPAQALRLITRNKISLATVMPVAYRQRIQQVPGVREVMVSQWFGGVYKEQKNFFARFAAEPDRLFKIHPEFRMPEDQQKAFIADRAGCIIGRKTAEKYGIKLGERVTLKGDIFPITLELTTRGIYDDDDGLNDESLYFNLEYLYQSLSAGRRDFAGTFTILADSPESVAGIAQQVDAMFRNSTVQTKTESERNFQLGFVNFLGNVKLYLLAISAAITFTILLVAANTMAMSVRERIREVGILKTLGFANTTILGMILGEAAVLSVLGGALGVLVANVLCAVVRQAPVAFIPQLKTLTLAPPVLAACLGLALLIGVCSSFVPAYGASRTSILDSLRYTG